MVSILKYFQKKRFHSTLRYSENKIVSTRTHTEQHGELQKLYRGNAIEDTKVNKNEAINYKV